MKIFKEVIRNEYQCKCKVLRIFSHNNKKKCGTVITLVSHNHMVNNQSNIDYVVVVLPVGSGG